MSDFEKQYINIMSDIINNGVRVKNRTGVDSYTTWGQTLKIDLSKGFPLITTRKVPLRIAFEETWFFLRGETDTKKLEEKKINIWKGNTSREFLDGRGLTHLPEGHLGKTYGFQMRNFGGDYSVDSIYDLDWKGVDQVSNLLKGLKNDPSGRRHIVTCWNPQQLDDMSLQPCHLYQQYNITNGKLNSNFIMRSWDFAYGSWVNIAGYALLNHVYAKYLNVQPGTLFCVGNDVHLYENQIDICKEQITRAPFDLPQINITKNISTIDDILNLEFKDIEFTRQYIAHPDFKNKPKMAV